MFLVGVLFFRFLVVVMGRLVFFGVILNDLRVLLVSLYMKVGFVVVILFMLFDLWMI